MIREHCFSPAWISQNRSKGLTANQHIIEKSIRAVALLSHLSETGLEFVFKGGTSLLLHLTCFQFCGQLLRKFPVDANSIKLAAGCNALQNHLVDCRFSPQFEAKAAASKAACAAAIILANKTDRNMHFLKFNRDNITDLTRRSLANQFAPLNRLKNVNPEAFHYWTIVQDIMGQL